MELPLVKGCQAADCAYNRGRKCHTPAITVGNSDKALCDTYWPGHEGGGEDDISGHVGACRTESCRYNVHLECSAREIQVGTASHQAFCQTFSRET